MGKGVTVWQEPAGSLVPASASSAAAIAEVARSLTSRDQRQIVAAYEVGSYEMMAGFVLNKSLSLLKRNLATLGMEFVGEMLGRQDLDDDSVPTVSISNHEAIRLARELGVIRNTDATRLAQHVDLLAHFEGLEASEAETAEMSREEALLFFRTCVNAVLGRSDNVAPTEFVRFREQLETRTFKASEAAVETLKNAPYFFKKTTLSILLANIKTRSGAQYEHTLGNTVVLVPEIWSNLRDPDRWSVGQAYAETVNAGKSAAVTALKKALMSVQGFDFVPESLRSQTFSAAASTIINVHSAANNFYNEPSAVSALTKLGTTIPWPAFPVCMSSVIAVYLGNMYGHTWDAQTDVERLLRRLTDNQWAYYVNECLPNDELILGKLAWHAKPRARWHELVESFDLQEREYKTSLGRRLVRAVDDTKLSKVASDGLKALTK